MRGVERRIEAGLDPVVGSVASVFMSRWDVAVADEVPDAPARPARLWPSGSQTYRAYRELMDSDRWQRLENAGARMQRLLWASTSTKDPKAPDTLYVHGLGGAVHGQHDARGDARRPSTTTARSATPMPADGGDADATLAEFAQAGVDVDALAAKLQADGATVVRRRLERPDGAHRRAERGARA